MKLRLILLVLSFLAFLSAYGFPYLLQAKDLINLNGIYYISSGKYYVEEDEKGIYLRTDQDLSWYLDKDDLGVFRLGESGLYHLKTNINRPHIVTDKNRLFDINQEAPKNLKTERSDAYTDNELYVIIKGTDKFYTKSGDYYVTQDEARMGLKGQPTLEWESKKAKEKARKRAEAEALIRNFFWHFIQSNIFS